MLKDRLAKYLAVCICGVCGLLLWICSQPKYNDLPSNMVDIGPVEYGFVTVFEVPSAIIEPDLAHYVDFRTSQLALFNGRVYASRRVLYRSLVSPKVVLVLTLDVTENADILQQILTERKDYCLHHGYGLYARYVQDFAAENKPAWEALGLAPMRLLRQAMLAFPTAEWFWLLSSAQGEIRDAGISLEQRLSEELSSVMLPELELKLNIDASGQIQEERFILTNFATNPGQVKFILSYDPDHTLLSSGSMIIRQSLPARALMETLSDPVIQEHEPFSKTTDHAGAALTHLARWHPLIVRSMALVTPEWIGTKPCDQASESDFVCLSTRKGAPPLMK